ncbi:MAG: calcium-binding protein, partial [Pseudorhodobacter sp.]
LEVKGYYTTDWGSYVLTAVSNAPTLTGTANADRLQGGAGATVINGNAGNDWMDGGAGNDRLFGSTGNDRLYGNADSDKLYGGSGDDQLYGGSGNDTLEGEAGNDVLAGGTGSDRFVFRSTSNSDTITDFQDGADRIQIVGVSGFGGLTLSTVGEDVRISFGTVRILVEDITRAELTSADFIFS